MIARLGSRLADLAERVVPHPLVVAMLLAGAIVPVGIAAWPAEGLAEACRGTLNAWYAGMFDKPMLAFGFQMALILVTGYVVADSPIVRRALTALGARWRTPAGAAALVALSACLLSWVHWGLGLVGAALLAREVGRVAAARRAPIAYPVVVAAAYAGFLTWHAGLSGSAPLTVAQESHAQGALVGSIPVGETIFSLRGLAFTLVLTLAVSAIAYALARSAPPTPVENLPRARIDPSEELRGEAQLGGAVRLERLRVVSWVVAVPGAAAVLLVIVPRALRGEPAFDLNAVLLAFLVAGLLLQGTPAAMTRAFGAGTREAAGILLQFPLYFAVMGVMRESGLAASLAQGGVDAARALSQLGLPADTSFELTTFASAAAVNLFVPSGGGQWAVQGEIVLRATLDPRLGVDPARAVMAFAHGDAWSNMLQPFWAIALLSLTGAKAREIMGYTAAIMILTFPLYVAFFAL